MDENVLIHIRLCIHNNLLIYNSHLFIYLYIYNSHHDLALHRFIIVFFNPGAQFAEVPSVLTTN